MTGSMREFLDTIEEKLTPPASAQARQLAQEAREKIAALYTELPTTAVPDPFESGAVTQAWLDDVLDRQAERDRLDAASRVLQSFIKEAEGRANALRPDTTALLDAYHQRLQTLLTETTKVVRGLAGADTADKAISAGRTAQWGRLAELAADYRLLRDAQVQLYPGDLVISSRPAIGGEQHASDLFLANLDDLWPTWRHPELSPGTVYPNSPGRIDRREPWPADPVELLRWLVVSDATPWIPTRPQLAKLRAERAARGNPNPQPAVKPANFKGPKLAPQYPTVKPIVNIN